MKIKGYSFQCANPFFVYFKKHYCPYCGEKLIRKKVSQIIHSDSEEAKNYDFEVADITVKGNMKLDDREVESLLNKLLCLPNPFTCPHGRPTAVKMTKTDLEKKFNRR